MKLFSLALLLVLIAGEGHTQTRRARKPATPAKTAPSTPAPPEGAAWVIETLVVQGIHNYTADQILAVAGIHAGDTAGKTEFEAARQRLLATGVFATAGYHFAPAMDNKGYDASFEVSEIEQMYPARFEHLPATDAELRAWLKQKDPLFAPKIPATKPELDRYAQWIAEFLDKRDYHEPVAGRVISENPSEFVIVFLPAKGLPVVARAIFTNTGAVPAGTAQTAMYGVAIGIAYGEPQYRLLLDTTIRPLYEARGMIRVSFPKIETEPAKDVDGLVVTTQVEPGPVYKLGKVGFRGAATSASELDKLANLKTEQPVNFDEVKAAQQRIEQRFRREGYLHVKTEIKRDPHDAEHTVDLTFQITPGPQFTQGKLDIVGLDLVSEPVIRKMWGLQPGKPFNVDYPDHFLERVKGDGIFDNLKSTRAETKVNANEQTVDVTLYFNK
ncbi:MAG TPA: POTRA domain-containing protein [Bryobacteraceae bacterium]|jgi:outer membrane protein insertion porin family|nr:POTRA domain-containing protein [Bryobacteraceae bacterium]